MNRNPRFTVVTGEGKCRILSSYLGSYRLALANEFQVAVGRARQTGGMMTDPAQLIGKWLNWPGPKNSIQLHSSETIH